MIYTFICLTVQIYFVVKYAKNTSLSTQRTDKAMTFPGCFMKPQANKTKIIAILTRPEPVSAAYGPIMWNFIFPQCHHS